MRLDLRLHGRTADGRECRADVSIYVKSKSELHKEADKAAKTAAWMTAEAPYEPIPQGSTITIEHVERI